MRNKLFDANGVVKLAPKMSERDKIKKVNEIDQKRIDFCLNCNKKRCNGNCKYIRRVK